MNRKAKKLKFSSKSMKIVREMMSITDLKMEKNIIECKNQNTETQKPNRNPNSANLKIKSKLNIFLK